MKTLTLSTEAKKAVVIGSMCSLSYLAVYVAKNVLSASSPQMVESGVFTNEQIGTLSSVYFITYAVGQLINGAIGDKIKAKYMMSVGLACAGICNLLFCKGTCRIIYTSIKRTVTPASDNHLSAAKIALESAKLRLRRFCFCYISVFINRLCTFASRIIRTSKELTESSLFENHS